MWSSRGLLLECADGGGTCVENHPANTNKVNNIIANLAPNISS